MGPEFLGTTVSVRMKLDSESHNRLGLFRRRFGLADRGFHFLSFRWRDHGRDAERLDPQLPAPAGRVVAVFVLHPLIGGLEYRLLRAFAFSATS